MQRGCRTRVGFRLWTPESLAFWVLLVPACAGPHAPAPPSSDVWTDGVFEEWGAVPVVATDPLDDVPGGAAVDFGTVRIHDDARFLHLQLDIGGTVTAQGLLGSVEILLDGDGDTGTGLSAEGLAGIDVAVVLSRPGADPEGYGFGVGVRLAEGTAFGPILSGEGVGLLVSPTHSSDRFEVRLRRGRPLGRDVLLAGTVGVGVRGVVRYVRGEHTVDGLGPFRYVTQTDAVLEDPVLVADSLVRSGGAVRVVAWNVSSERFRTAEAAFQRVLRAVDPDVVLLDEVFEEVTPTDLDRFFKGVPADSARAWTWWLGSGGGPQRTVVAARGFPVSGEPALARIEYEAPDLAGWVQAAGGSEAVLRKAEFELEAGLSATGAWADIGGLQVLFVPVDLQSRGHDGSPEDLLREVQARVLNRALANVVDSREDVGVVIGGDLNLVGSDRPLSILRAGLEAGKSPLTVARPLNWIDRSLVTWRSVGNADAFSPGRLDYVLYRGSRLEAIKSFVFDAGQLSSADRSQLGLRANDTIETWEHLPVVVDFRVR